MAATDDDGAATVQYVAARQEDLRLDFFLGDGSSLVVVRARNAVRTPWVRNC
jgi:hypothetical protein